MKEIKKQERQNDSDENRVTAKDAERMQGATV